MSPVIITPIRFSACTPGATARTNITLSSILSKWWCKVANLKIPFHGNGGIEHIAVQRFDVSRFIIINIKKELEPNFPVFGKFFSYIKRKAGF
jgi:hypothetical protein